MNKIEKFIGAYCIVVAVLFAFGAVAVWNGGFTILRNVFGGFLALSSVFYVLLAYLLSRPKPEKKA